MDLKLILYKAAGILLGILGIIGFLVYGYLFLVSAGVV